MAAPVINTITSVHAYSMGDRFVIQPAATNSPLEWEALGLPAGVVCNEDTGKITGPATEWGFFNVTLRATNGDGTGELIFPLGIEPGEVASGAGIELDYNLANDEVSNPGMDGSLKTEDGLPVAMFGKLGDKRLISVGFKKGTLLQQLEIARVDVAIKEFEGEGLLLLTSGLFELTGAFDTARYRILVSLEDTAKLRGILSGYEGDRDTYFDAVAEVRFTLLHAQPGDEDPQELERTSQNFVWRIARDLAPAPEEE